MEGMLWAALFMVAVPLAIGLGVLVHLLRRGRTRPQPEVGAEPH